MTKEDRRSACPSRKPAAGGRTRDCWSCWLPADARHVGYDAARQELISRAAKLAYPIRGGVPIMLPEEARKLDSD